jgi:hypothetical protein
MGPSAQNARDNAKFPELERIVMMELGNKIVAADDAYAKDMYAHLATDKQIKAAFKNLGYAPRRKYGDGCGRWGDLPDVAAKESELYEKFVKIADAVIKNLGNPGGHGTRTPEDTHSKHFVHRDNASHMSRPDISIVATGPSFESPDGKAKVGYSNMASFLEVKREEAGDTDDDLIQQTGVYAR